MVVNNNEEIDKLNPHNNITLTNNCNIANVHLVILFCRNLF